ncbi:MAG: precorrin-4 C(11)-methyltransferase [Pseudomonadota bacterium]
MDKHVVHFVGAGPGDPELITVRGRRLLEAADLVVYAGSLVPEAVLQWTRDDARRLDSAGMTLEDIVAAMVTACRRGERVVRLHTGDPSLYGAIFEQMVQLDAAGVSYAVTPGVTAAFAAAAALQMEYTLPERCQTLILTRMAGRTPVPETESLASLAAHRAAMAIYLSLKQVAAVADILAGAYGPDAPCAVAYRVSHPDEKLVCCRIADLVARVAAEGITRQALILVGAALGARSACNAASSRLYDAGFSHGFRKAAVDADTP